ncbi:MAG: hypothetical protein ACPHL6_10950, partial [Rubripirellula sp.]
NRSASSHKRSIISDEPIWNWVVMSVCQDHPRSSQVRYAVVTKTEAQLFDRFSVMSLTWGCCSVDL